MRLAQKIVLSYIRTRFTILAALSMRKAAEKAFRLFTTPQSRNRKKLPPIFEKAESIRFPFNGETIQGYRWNHPSESGRKALILHGYESSVINFDRYVKPLIRKGYEVLAFDAPAHGRSTGKTLNALVYKNLVMHIHDVYGPIQSYIAHSFGGLSLTLALAEIEHGPDYRVVLIAPATETTRAIDNFFRFLRLPPGMRPEFDRIIEKIGTHPASWYSITRAAPHIRAQVLFLQDKQDNMTPYSDVLPLMEKDYPNFRFIISDGLGHRRIYRDNASVKAILEFL